MPVRNKMLHFRVSEEVLKKIDKLSIDIGTDNRSWLLNSLVLYVYDHSDQRSKFVSTLKKLLPYL